MQYFKTHTIFFLFSISIQFLCAGNTLIPTGKSGSDIENGSKQFKLLWQDDFDGKTNDLKKNWQIEFNGKGGGNNELQYYRKNNIRIGKEPVSGESCLVITAKKENFLFHPYTSGRLSTRNKISFRYGRIEARIKVPTTANGLWPAFWMLGNGFPKINWPKCGEIDILEMGNAKGIKNGVQNRYFNGACHWGEDFNFGSYPNYSNSSVNEYPLDNDFHLFTMIWDETAIKMFLDLDKFPANKPYYNLPLSGENKPGNAIHYFNKQFFIIFNLAVGGNFTGILHPEDVTALTNGDAKMYVDFVKVYQKGLDNEVFSDNIEGSITRTAEIIK